MKTIQEFRAIQWTGNLKQDAGYIAVLNKFLLSDTHPLQERIEAYAILEARLLGSPRRNPTETDLKEYIKTFKDLCEAKKYN